MAKTYLFTVPKVKCHGCVGPVESILRDHQESLGIECFAVDPDSKTLIIVPQQEPPSSNSNLSDEICKLLAHYQCSVKAQSFNAEENSKPPPKPLWQKILTSHVLWGVLGSLAGFTVLILSFFTAGMPLGAVIAIGAVSTGLTLLIGAPFYWEAARNFFKQQTLSMDSLFAISTISVLTVSVAAFFFPALPMMFEAGLMIFGFRHLGIAIEESIKQSAGFRGRFQDRLPQSVIKISSDNTQEKRPLLAISPEDTILVSAGECIPVDGVCETENSSIYETITNGSIWPRKTKKGERLKAGMRLADNADPVYLKVTATADASHLAKLDESLLLAQTQKIPLQTFTDKALQYFIPTVIIVALLSFAGLACFFPPAVAIQFAAAVLVSACPCTLGFIIPLAVKIGVNKALDHGVRFTNGKTLQDAEQVESVVFDLNGTLTEGLPRVSRGRVLANSNISMKQMLANLAVLEKTSKHPVAEAIKQYINDQQMTLSPELSVSGHEETHAGIKATINGIQCLVGSENLMRQSGITLPDIAKQNRQVGESVIYFAMNQKIAGYLVMTDPLRDKAGYAIESLKKLGKKIYICTGADEATAHRYANEIKIPKKYVYAACNENRKKALITELKNKGQKVAMVGDAGNDAVAIAASDFGIAVQSPSGDYMTQDRAGAVVQSGSLMPIVSVFAIARQSVSNIKQNLAISLSYNASTLLLGIAVVALGFSIHPALGVVLMMTQSSLVLYNAYRFKNQVMEHLQKPAAQTQTPKTSHGLMSKLIPQRQSTAELAVQTNISTEIEAKNDKEHAYGEKNEATLNLGLK